MAQHPPRRDEPAARRLAACGLRSTAARLEVYRVLSQASDHPTAEEIFLRVRRRAPSVSLATVYNSLEALRRAGLIGVMNELHGRARYDAVVERHHHLICRRCGGVEDLHDAEFDGLRPGEETGFSVEDLSVHFFGTCRSCGKAGSQEPGQPPR